MKRNYWGWIKVVYVWGVFYVCALQFLYTFITDSHLSCFCILMVLNEIDVVNEVSSWMTDLISFRCIPINGILHQISRTYEGSTFAFWRVPYSSHNDYGNYVYSNSVKGLCLPYQLLITHAVCLFLWWSKLISTFTLIRERHNSIVDQTSAPFPKHIWTRGGSMKMWTRACSHWVLQSEAASGDDESFPGSWAGEADENESREPPSVHQSPSL